jgi:hypothetical protein
MSKHPKPGGGNQHSQPKNKDTQNEERGVSGNVHVRGEVVVEFGPEETNTRNSSEKKEDARKRKIWWLEVATFIVLSIYAGLTAWQSWSTQKIVTLTREQFTKDQRPYVWISKPKFFPPQSGQKMSATVDFLNFGKSPALNIKTDFRSLEFGPNGEKNIDVIFNMPKGIKITYPGPPSLPIPPGGKEGQIPIPEMLTQSLGVMSDSDVQWMNTHSPSAVFGGIVRYEDMSGNIYETYYCVVRWNNTDVFPCIEHNEIH